MQFTDFNGQIVMPVSVFKKSNLSVLAMGVFAWLCARSDLNVHKDQEIADELDLELAEWFAVKVELVQAKLINSSPIEDTFSEEEYQTHIERVKEEISKVE